ncbi:MAG: hypothetical protein CMG61_00310 [Candidatus Marinimicrobia bacterium]|nr:hypothetical protein [Candidatus Neomarinimicrobiota bacterium]|tara:strand:- start:18754 stop:21645 length:2892 start_codon:yes stop_codon:yes gene_type:complete
MKNLFILLFTSYIFSASVNNEYALNIAENFYYFKKNPESNIFSYDSIQLFDVENTNTFYVIELNPTGFILVSADDLIRPVLAYSFDENFRFDNIPTNINYIFKLYKTELLEQAEERQDSEFISSEWTKFSRPVDYEPETRNVSPLLMSRFDQGSSWNDMCPEDQDGPGGNVLVGCVAVSMAQIMHYWSYPNVGVGSHGYTHPQYGYQFANFGNSYYDYTQMENNYATTESQELLYHCGVAVNMGYGVDGSGANVFGNGNTTERAMRDYFLFKNNLDSVEPWQYGTVAYRELLQTELNNNRPMIYVGYDNEGGHAWNIDGYSGEYFHNNWGWGGSQNGYFLLSSLNGFNSGQGALINMEPQTLDNPNVILQSFDYDEYIGDGDLIANPGETISLSTTVENLVPWTDASSIDMILSTDNEDIIINNEHVTFFNLTAGNDYTNSNDPFLVSFSQDIDFSTHQLKLNILSFGSNGEYHENEYYIDISVSLDQVGFPYQTTVIDENNEEYDAVTVVQSSPLLYDINNDGTPEIFFGEDGGYFHGVDIYGNSLNGFPVQIPGNDSDIWGSPVAADIDNDYVIEFVISSKNKHCYVINQFGNIELEYETSQYLMASPSLANLDNDDDLEIIMYGYSSSGDIFAINNDGSSVNNFPAQINEKILKGGAIYDINNNGYDDIVVATENDKLIAIIYDDGTIEELFTSSDKFKSIPSIIDYNGEIIITAGDEGGNFYGLKLDGTLAFHVITGNNVRSSAGFIEIDSTLGIFFGSEDGNLYGIDINGNNLNGWPQNILQNNTEIKINSSPVFADVNGDGSPEIIAASEQGHLIIYNIDGTQFENFPLSYNYGFISSPTIVDLDGDNDLEIVIGTAQNLSVIDLKYTTYSDNSSYWNTYQGDSMRSGVYIYSGSNIVLGDLNEDSLIDVLDLVIVINIIIGNEIPNTNQLISGDINTDNTIDVLDIVQLVNSILSN